MSKANLLLKNDVGLVLDITESPLGCTVYDLEGNIISGGGGGGGVNVTTLTAHIVNNTNNSLDFGSVIETYDGYGCIKDGYVILSGQSGTESIVIPANSTYDIIFSIMAGTGYVEVSSNTGTVSDGVNVEIDSGDYVDINIEDNSTDGSFTFTIN